MAFPHPNTPPADPTSPPNTNTDNDHEMGDVAPPDAAPLRPTSSSAPRYSADFEDALMNLMLHPPAPDGIQILDDTFPRQEGKGTTIHIREIDAASLPYVGASELPLPLDDPRRVYRSAVPGARLTHPSGALAGGPGPRGAHPLPAASSVGADAERDRGQVDDGRPGDLQAETKAFIGARNVRTGLGLRRALLAEQQAQLKALRERMERRRRALDANQAVEREVKKLEAQREMERMLEQRVRERARGKG